MTPRLPPWLLLPLLLGSCTLSTRDGGPAHPVDLSSIPDAVPQNAPRSRHGNPSSYRVLGHTYHVLDDARGFRQRGIASWYGTKFHGRRTSSGEPYDMYAMTAAHKTLPLPTWVRVTNLENGRSVVVKINDRGPFHKGRIIDLSYVAAAKLGMLGKGTAPVEIVALTPGKPAPKPRQTSLGGGRGHYHYLQVGAFSSLPNARSLQRRLQRRHSCPVAIREEDGLHKVIVGPLQAKKEVEAISHTLEAWGIRPRHLVQ